MYKIILTLFVMNALSACSSTPYRDDFAQHVQLKPTHQLQLSDITIQFEEAEFVELRGIYNHNDAMSGSTIMYDGSAGLAGMLVQIGAHAAMVNSGRDNKLSAQQEQANKNIQLLLDRTGQLPLSSLINDDSIVVAAAKSGDNTLRIKPIFFSNPKMSRLSLKLVAWLPNNDKKANLKKSPFRYQNMVHIYGLLPESDDSVLLHITADELTESYRHLFNTAIAIVKQDVTGKFKLTDTKAQSFILKQDFRNTVIRGKLAAEDCNYQIVKNLRNWFIAIPKATANASIAETNDIDDKDIAPANPTVCQS